MLGQPTLWHQDRKGNWAVPGRKWFFASAPGPASSQMGSVEAVAPSGASPDATRGASCPLVMEARDETKFQDLLRLVQGAAMEVLYMVTKTEALTCTSIDMPVRQIRSVAPDTPIALT